MAVLINLLPKERQAKIRDKRNKSLVLYLSIGISGAVIGVTIILLIITQAQEVAISRLQSDIELRQAQLTSTPNFQEMVTLQQNLAAVPDLYAKRRVLSRFLDLVEQVAPRDLKLNTLALNEEGVMQASGSTSSYRLLTKLAKAMEKAGGQSPYFTDVKLPGAAGVKGRVTFTLTAGVSAQITAARKSQ